MAKVGKIGRSGHCSINLALAAQQLSSNLQALALSIVRENLKLAPELITLDVESHKRKIEGRNSSKYTGLEQRLIVDTVDVHVQV
jgi:hypothetical protein